MCNRFEFPNHLFLSLHQSTAWTAVRSAAVAAAGSLDAELFAHAAALDCVENPLHTAEQEGASAYALLAVSMKQMIRRGTKADIAIAAPIVSKARIAAPGLGFAKEVSRFVLIRLRKQEKGGFNSESDWNRGKIVIFNLDNV